MAVATLSEVGPRLPEVARRAIAAWLSGDGYGVLSPLGPCRPVFVTLRAQDGKLRGCVGSVVPARRDVVSETARCAVLAATVDPRFSPVSTPELARLFVEVSVLGDEERIAGAAELDPLVHCVVVRDDLGHEAALLPNLEGITDAETQIDVACRKAGIARGASVELGRHVVHKWCEPPKDELR